MLSPRFRVALISAGRMSSTIDDEIREQDTWPSLKRQLPYSHAPCYRTFPEVEMVAVCDLDEARCRRFCERWDVPRYYLDYREMIDRERPDILSIATPAHLHAEMAVFAMEHGVRGIYCEKAMCCSLREADAIVDAAQRNGVKFMLGAQRRHHPHFRKARELVASGTLGGLVAVASWLESSLLHSLSHLADNSLYLAGDAAPVSVFGVLGYVRTFDELESRRITHDPAYDPATQTWNGDPGCRSYTVELENGVLLVHLPSVADVRWEVTCTNGFIRIDNNNDTLKVFRRRGQTYSFDPVEIDPIPPASSHQALVRDLLNALETDGRTLANEIVGRYGMEILVGVAHSHLQGGARVDLPLADRDMVIPS
ncbi:MAG: hypothetical protein GF393_00180, partial [Armatimonadia bacterium]|nr:hypothetical protein [Armatimonadia bacterium]